MLTNGVTFKQKELNSLKELTGEFDIVINCTGLGARKLCDDRRLVSIRGQVLKVCYLMLSISSLLINAILTFFCFLSMQVKAPWIKTFFYGELDTYIIPGFHGMVTLGGSRGFDSENMKLCPYESAAIRERCETFVPSVKDAELLRQEVGLRPHREGGARIGEGNIVHSDCSNKTIVSTLTMKRVTYSQMDSIILFLQIVHNYGHGGYGVCMAPGTAIATLDTVVELHKVTCSKI